MTGSSQEGRGRPAQAQAGGNGNARTQAASQKAKGGSMKRRHCYTAWPLRMVPCGLGASCLLILWSTCIGFITNGIGHDRRGTADREGTAREQMCSQEAGRACAATCVRIRWHLPYTVVQPGLQANRAGNKLGTGQAWGSQREGQGSMLLGGASQKGKEEV